MKSENMTVAARGRRPLLLLPLFLLLLTLISSACGDSAANNSANMPQNVAYNGPSNSTSNTNTMSNSTFLPPETFDPAALKTDLKARLMTDNGALLKPGSWTTDAWLEKSVGMFYKNNQEITSRIVCDVTDETLARYNRKLKDFARVKLHNEMKTATLCKDALKLMGNATLSIKAIYADQ